MKKRSTGRWVFRGALLVGFLLINASSQSLVAVPMTFTYDNGLVQMPEPPHLLHPLGTNLLFRVL